jgi:hypothetical protein
LDELDPPFLAGEREVGGNFRSRPEEYFSSWLEELELEGSVGTTSSAVTFRLGRSSALSSRLLVSAAGNEEILRTVFRPMKSAKSDMFAGLKVASWRAARKLSLVFCISMLKAWRSSSTRAVRGPMMR